MLLTSLLASASLEDASIACASQRTVYTVLEHARKTPGRHVSPGSRPAGVETRRDIVYGSGPLPWAPEHRTEAEQRTAHSCCGNRRDWSEFFFLNGSWRGLPAASGRRPQRPAKRAPQPVSADSPRITGSSMAASAWRRLQGRPSPADNSNRPDFDTFDAIHVMKGDADGLIRESELAAWLRSPLGV